MYPKSICFVGTGAFGSKINISPFDDPIQNFGFGPAELFSAASEMILLVFLATVISSTSLKFHFPVAVFFSMAKAWNL